MREDYHARPELDVRDSCNGTVAVGLADSLGPAMGCALRG